MEYIYFNKIKLWKYELLLMLFHFVISTAKLAITLHITAGVFKLAGTDTAALGCVEI